MKKEIIRYHKVTCKDHEHLVLNQLDFSLYEKEVLGIVGLQTAWCEALCQTLTGMRRIDSGWIECMGEKTFFRSWQEARRHGIYYIQRKAAIIGNQTVASNILGLPDQTIFFQTSADNAKLSEPLISSRNIYMNTNRMNAIVNEYLKKWGLDIRAETMVDNLSRGEQLQVELCRAVMNGAKVIIFDRIGKFCNLGLGFIDRILRWLIKENVSVILVDNQLDPMVDVAHRIMVMKEGTKEGIFDKGELTREALIYLIADRSFQEKYKRRYWAGGELCNELEIGGVDWNERLKLHQGEIIAVMESEPRQRDVPSNVLQNIKIISASRMNKSVDTDQIRELLKQGIFTIDGRVPYFGLVPNVNLEINLNLLRLNRFVKKSVGVSRLLMRFVFREYASEMGLIPEDWKKYPSEIGGLQQFRLCLQRGILNHAKILLLWHPSQQLDFISRQEMCAILDEVTKRGISILLISQNIDICGDLCDRVLLVGRHRRAWVEREELEAGNLLTYMQMMK